MKNKKFKPMDYAFENMKLSAGIAIGGMIVEDINSSTGSHIDTGPTMNMISKLPMIHAAGGMFQSLEDLNKQIKKKK
jgi:hypothetical protein